MPNLSDVTKQKKPAEVNEAGSWRADMFWFLLRYWMRKQSSLASEPTAPANTAFMVRPRETGPQHNQSVRSGIVFFQCKGGS